MSRGQIRKALSGFYYIDYNGTTYQTRARGNFRKKNITPLVGDYVEFESDNVTDGYILEVYPRKNALVRPTVANVDQAIVLMSCKEPDFSPVLLDRFLVTLEAKKIQPIIYLTKSDLLEEAELAEIKLIRKQYQKIGYQVILPLEDGEQALAEIWDLFPDRLTVFMGQSGVGKSTLLNKISPELNLKTGEISESLNRGKHTTRHVELVALNKGLVADTPGFSAIDLLDLTAVELRECFPELKRASEHCKFRECLHLHEPKCYVKELVMNGEIAQGRYDNYLQFLAEIEQRRPVYNKSK